MRRWLKRLLTPFLLVAATVFFLVEELLWRLAAVFALLGKLPVFREIEQWIGHLPPYGALAIFAVPALALAPVKLLALYWLAGGHPMLGIGTILTAKVAGTALVARIYQLTRHVLLTLSWFAWCEAQVLALRAAAYGLWRSLPVGRWVTQRWHAWKERGRGWVSRRWAAIRRKDSLTPQ
ncbi:MAG: hypothetical protein K2X03_30125 [Bryobacteraceae bacterium]|nr:hypothetical protein [Bryobacteraceae bacterium]